MKVFSINIFAEYGSTGKIVQAIHSQLLKMDADSYICYGRGKRLKNEKYYKTTFELLAKFYKIVSYFTGDPNSFASFETYKLIKLLKKEKPDIVHIHCLNCFYINTYTLLEFLKQQKIKTVLTLHAELMYTGGCAHSYDCDQWKLGCKKCPNLVSSTGALYFDKTSRIWNNLNNIYINFNELTIVAVSNWLYERAKQSLFFKDKRLLCINNGIDTSIYKPNTNNRLRNIYANWSHIVLHVNPTFTEPSKGGQYIIELAKRNQKKNILFIIIGYKGRKNILPPNIKALPIINDTSLIAEYYSIADLTIIASKKETYSLVCAESLSCGTPVVGFKAGAPELISDKRMSEFVKYGDLVELENAMNRWLDMKTKLSTETIELVRNKYSSEAMANAYISLYKELT